MTRADRERRQDQRVERNISRLSSGLKTDEMTDEGGQRANDEGGGDDH